MIVPGERYPKTMGGYYDSIPQALVDLQFVRGISSYVMVNPGKPELLARMNSNKIRPVGKGELTKDTQIVRLNNAFIDIDSIRDTGISSTDEEFTRATEVMGRILDDHPEIRAASWWGSSGNGGWILPKIGGLPNDDEHNALVARFLYVLGRKYTGEDAKVDQTTKNPSRIMCIPGTRKCKGSNTADRPHRLGHNRHPRRPCPPDPRPPRLAGHP